MAVGHGRRKIPMSLIDDKSTRKTTFKKRKNGLFKKAMELSILTNCKVMVFVFNEKDTDISEYSTIDPTTMMQMYVDQAVLPHDKFTNDDYDTIGLKPAERKRLGLKSPGKKEPTLLPPMLQAMENPETRAQLELAAAAKKKKQKPKPDQTQKPEPKADLSPKLIDQKKVLKRRRLTDDSEEITSVDQNDDVHIRVGGVSMGVGMGGDIHLRGGDLQTDSHSHLQDLNLATPIVNDNEFISDNPQSLYSNIPIDVRNDTSSTGAPIVMPQFMLQDPNKTGRLSTVRKHGTFSSPAFRIGLTPSPGGIQTPRSGDDSQNIDSINSYFPSSNGIYSPNLDELLQTTPKG